jgi:hypothetical protein
MWDVRCIQKMQRPDSRQCLPCRLTKNPNSCLILVCSSTSSMTRYPCLPEQEEAIYSGQVTRKTYMYCKFHILAAATKAIKSKFLSSWDVSRCHCITQFHLTQRPYSFNKLSSVQKKTSPPPRRLSSSNRRSRKKTPGRWSSDNKKQDITKKPGYLATNTIYLSTHALKAKHKCKKEEEEDAPSPYL